MPALPLARLGHGARLPCAPGGRRRGGRAAGARAASIGWQPRQVLDVAATGSAQRPNVRPGGWAFQYANPHYPDLDDTAVVVMAMDRAGAPARRGRRRIRRRRSRAGANGSTGLQSRGRRLGRVRRRQYLSLPEQHPVRRSRRAARSADGRRHRALRLHAGAARRDARLRALRWRAASTTSSHDQEPDGQLVRPLGHELHLRHLVGALRAQRRRDRPAVSTVHAPRRRLARRHPERGRRLGRGRRELQARLCRLRACPEHAVADRLGAPWHSWRPARSNIRPSSAASPIWRRTQGTDGLWPEERFTATGFPRVFYLRYHGYAKFFPLWALARYRNLKRGNSRAVALRHVNVCRTWE